MERAEQLPDFAGAFIGGSMAFMEDEDPFPYLSDIDPAAVLQPTYHPHPVLARPLFDGAWQLVEAGDHREVMPFILFLRGMAQNVIENDTPADIVASGGAANDRG